MRFITEFEIRAEDNKDVGYRKMLLFNQKANRQIEMGQMIANSFGWENPVNNNLLHHRLEIEAFPMDKWIEFKQKLGYHINESGGVISANYILNIIKELESFGKPAGVAKDQ